MFYGLLMRHGMVSFLFYYFISIGQINVFTVAIREVNGVYNNWDSEMDRIHSFPSSSNQFFSNSIPSILSLIFFLLKKSSLFIAHHLIAVQS